MLILAHTRELMIQSERVLEKFGNVIGFISTVIYGDVPNPPQKNILSKGVDCIVGTPGGLMDLVNEGIYNLSKISQLVLDEADWMLDTGFEKDVCYIIYQYEDKETH